MAGILDILKDLLPRGQEGGRWAQPTDLEYGGYGERVPDPRPTTVLPSEGSRMPAPGAGRPPGPMGNGLLDISWNSPRVVPGSAPISQEGLPNPVARRDPVDRAALLPIRRWDDSGIGALRTSGAMDALFPGGPGPSGGFEMRPPRQPLKELTKKLIISQEGFNSRAYDDHGYYSIGFGTRTDNKDEVISHEEGLRRLDNRVSDDLDWLQDKIPDDIAVQLSDQSWAALGSLVYNVGRDAFLNSEAYTALMARNLDLFETEAFDKERGFVKARDKAGKKYTLPGLQKRRAEEAKWWQAGLVPTNVNTG